MRNYNYLMIMILIIYELYSYYKNINYIYNSFLIERLLHNYKFKKTSCITNYNGFYRDREHIIGIKSEQSFLKDYFRF